MLLRRSEIALPDWLKVLKNPVMVISAVQARWDNTVNQVKFNDK